MKIVFNEVAIESSPFCWLIEIGSHKLGVHQNNGWCMQLDGRIILFDSEDKCVPLGPILEIELGELLNYLKRAADANPMYSDSIRKFPIELLLKHIFHTSFSGYWPEKALGWLDVEKNLQLAFKEELEKFASNKTMPQAARQKAQKMLHNSIVKP